MPTRFAIAAVFMSLLVPFIAIAEPESDPVLLQVLTGFEYARGDYGLPELGVTEVMVVPLSVRLRRGAWTMRATLPLLDVSGPAAVGVLVDDGGAAGGAPGGNANGSGDSPFDPARRERGPGDLTLSLTHAFNALGGTPIYADAIGRLRVPTGDADRGLGSGAFDVIVGGETGYADDIGGVFAAAARRFLGNGPRVTRVDGWQWSAGGWANIGALSELGVAYGWRAGSVRTAPASRAVEMNVGTLVGGRWQCSAIVSRGLSDGAPDWSIGATVAAHFKL